MELVYLWVEDYKNIRKQGFDFSPRFECEFFPEYEKDINGKEKLKDNCKLIIKPKENYVEDFFSKNINITAIIGENGTGKSSVLEIIKYGSSLNYDFKTKIETIYPQCFYVLYDKNDGSYIFKGAEKKQDKNIFYVTYSDKRIDEIFQNIYYSSSDTFYSYPELSTSYQISEHITNVTNAYMCEKLAETIQNNLNHKLTSYKQLIDYLENIHIENGINAFYKDNIKLPNHFNKPTSLIVYINYKYIYTAFKGVKLDENLHNKLQGLMSKFEQNDRNNIEYMIKHFGILSILIQYGRGLKNTLNFEIEDIFNDIDFTSSNFEIIDNIIIKLNKRYDIDGVENNILKEYFTSIFKIIKLLKDFDKYYKNEMFIIPIELEADKILELINLHKNITATTFSFFTYSFKPLMSSGHKTFFNFFGKLFYALNYQYNLLPKKNKKILLLLDEPDVFLHPDWQQKYINILINFLNINYSQYKFHIIITSHSPFILSDLPKENVIFLDKFDDETIKKYPKLNIKDLERGNCINLSSEMEDFNTFGANIHTLLSRGFFMKDGLMGEFAKEKINQVYNFIADNDTSFIKTKQEAQNIINLIGEPMLKKELQFLYDEKFEIDDIDKQIREHEEAIEKLKSKKKKND